MTRRCDSARPLGGGDLITAATVHSDAIEKWTTRMGTENSALLAEVIACKHIVDDYTKRLDEACAEYYSTGKTEYPNLSRAEDEDIWKHCELLITRLRPIIPDLADRWDSIKYQIEQYKEMVERMRDVWTRRRNLIRVIETVLKTNLQSERPPHPETNTRRTAMVSSVDRVLIIHGHDERNTLTLKDLLLNKLRLPEPVIMAQQLLPGASLPEKFEQLAANVAFAVALLTPDDVGRARASTDAKLKPRPRQNTLVEIGWFWGRLGRDRVLLLVKKELELPSDLQGVEYYRFDSRVEEVFEKVRDFFEAHRSKVDNA